MTLAVSMLSVPVNFSTFFIGVEPFGEFRLFAERHAVTLWFVLFPNGQKHHLPIFG